MKRFKACVVGMGFIGVVHTEALRRLGNVEVTAVCNTSRPEQKAAENNVPRGYADYREMIDQEKPDVLHICTPNNSHFDIAMYAMERGINVICEKPLTVTSAEARQMRDYARNHDLVCGVNFNFRFYPQVMQMKEMVRRGDVGDIYTVHGSYLQDWLFLDTDYSWRLEPELTGDSRAFADIGSHWIDMVESVTGLRAVEVLADFETFHKTRKKPRQAIATYSGMSLRPEDYDEVPISTEDYATVLYRFDNGAHGCCNISQVFAGRKNATTVAISGSKCALQWDSEDSNDLWVGRRETYNQVIPKDPSLLYPESSAINGYPGGHVEGFADSFKQNFKAIYAAIEAGDTSRQHFANFDDGLREMVLCEHIVQSARERRWVSIEQ